MQVRFLLENVNSISPEELAGVQDRLAKNAVKLNKRPRGMSDEDFAKFRREMMDREILTPQISRLVNEVYVIQFQLIKDYQKANGGTPDADDTTAAWQEMMPDDSGYKQLLSTDNCAKLKAIADIVEACTPWPLVGDYYSPFKGFSAGVIGRSQSIHGVSAEIAQLAKNGKENVKEFYSLKQKVFRLQKLLKLDAEIAKPKKDKNVFPGQDTSLEKEIKDLKTLLEIPENENRTNFEERLKAAENELSSVEMKKQECDNKIRELSSNFLSQASDKLNKELIAAKDVSLLKKECNSYLKHLEKDITKEIPVTGDVSLSDLLKQNKDKVVSESCKAAIDKYKPVSKMNDTLNGKSFPTQKLENFKKQFNGSRETITKHRDRDSTFKSFCKKVAQVFSREKQIEMPRFFTKGKKLAERLDSVLKEESKSKPPTIRK